MNLLEVTAGRTTRQRMAGIVPFLSDGRCLFVVSSDPAIAKGKIDQSEDSKAAAIRKGAEGLGLRADNMAQKPWLAWTGILRSTQGEYEFDAYAVLVKDADAFDKHESTLWLTESEFTTRGPKSQAQIMNRVYGKIEAYLDE